MSTLHVENLKGLSSGGNANKIIVPSGQTLDASHGFTPPTGYSVKTQAYVLASTSVQSVASTSFVELTTWGTPTFTKTKSTNLLYCNLHYFNYFTASPTYWWLKATVNNVNVTSNTSNDTWGNGMIDTHNATQYSFNQGAHQTRHTHFWDAQDTSSAVFRFYTKAQTTSAHAFWNDGHVTLTIQEIEQ